MKEPFREIVSNYYFKDTICRSQPCYIFIIISIFILLLAIWSWFFWIFFSFRLRLRWFLSLMSTFQISFNPSQWSPLLPLVMASSEGFENEQGQKSWKCISEPKSHSEHIFMLKYGNADHSRIKYNLNNKSAEHIYLQLILDADSRLTCFLICLFMSLLAYCPWELKWQWRAIWCTSLSDKLWNNWHV